MQIKNKTKLYSHSQTSIDYSIKQSKNKMKKMMMMRFACALRFVEKFKCVTRSGEIALNKINKLNELLWRPHWRETINF